MTYDRKDYFTRTILRISPVFSRISKWASWKDTTHENWFDFKSNLNPMQCSKWDWSTGTRTQIQKSGKKREFHIDINNSVQMHAFHLQKWRMEEHAKGGGEGTRLDTLRLWHENTWSGLRTQTCFFFSYLWWVPVRLVDHPGSQCLSDYTWRGCYFKNLWLMI